MQVFLLIHDITDRVLNLVLLIKRTMSGEVKRATLNDKRADHKERVIRGCNLSRYTVFVK